MKNFNYLTIAFLAIGTMAFEMNAAEGLKVEDFLLNASETKTVSVDKTTENPSEYAGFQFTVTPPEGVTIDAVTPNSAFPAEFKIFTADAANNGKTVIVVGVPSGNAATATPSSTVTDAIVDISLTGDPKLVHDNTGTLTFSKIIFTSTDVDNNKYTFDNSSCEITYRNVEETDVEIKPVPTPTDPDDPNNPDNPDSPDTPDGPNGPFGQDPDNDDPDAPDPKDQNYPTHESNNYKYFELFVGEMITFSASVDEDASNKYVTWTPNQSTEDLGVKIEGNSISISAKKISTQSTKFTATTYNGLTTSIEVKVVPMPIMSFELTNAESKNDLDIDETLKLNAEVTPAEKYTGEVTITWSVDNDCVEVTDNSGLITAKHYGDAVVTATAKGLAGEEKSDTYNIHVNALALTDFTLSSLYYKRHTDRRTLKVGEKLELVHNYVPEKASIQDIQYQVTPGNYISVSNGIVTALAEGVSTVTVTVTPYDGQTKTATMDIKVEGTPLYGDANDDTEVDVSDAVVVGNYIIEKTAKNFVFFNADVIPDEEIDIADQEEVINLALGISQKYNNNNFVGTVSSFKTDDHLVIAPVKKTYGNIDVNVFLENTNRYKSLQADVILPEGVTVSNVTAGERARNHSLIYNVTDANVLKVVLFSLDNRTFEESDKPLFVVSTQASDSDDIDIENVKALTEGSEKHELASTSTSDDPGLAYVESLGEDEVQVVPGIGEVVILGAEGKEVAVYDLAGRLINKGVASALPYTVNLAKGIYIVKYDSQSARIVVK